MPPTVDVLGVPLAVSDYAHVLDWMQAMIAAGSRGYVTAAAVNLVMCAQEDPDARAAVLGATLGACVGYVAGGTVGRLLNRTMVIGNHCVFGTVNANRRHYEMALDTLLRADKRWLGQLITRRVPLERFAEALERRPGDIKVIIDFLQ